MRTTTGSVNGNQPKPNSQAYPSSVPLYVYRELAVELKATQDKLDALMARNQQLAQENQMLRHEVSQVVQSFLHLQKVVDRPVPGSYPEMKNPNDYEFTEPQPRPQTVQSRQPVVPQPPSSKNQHFSYSIPAPQTVLIEEQETGYYPSPTSKAQAQEFKGWWLVICIVLIMLSAFGAGYLIVKPLFEHQGR